MLLGGSLFFETYDLMSPAMAASIESLFLIFGTPKKWTREKSLSMNTLFQTKHFYKRTQLEHTIHTPIMSVMLIHEIISNAKLEKHLHKNRNKFIIIQGFILYETLEH